MRTLLERLFKHPFQTAFLAALPLTAYGGYEFLQLGTNSSGKDLSELVNQGLLASGALTGWVPLGMAFHLAYRFTLDKETRQTIAQCYDDVDLMQRPTFPNREPVKLTFTLKDHLFESIYADSPSGLAFRGNIASYGRTHHKPAFLLYAADAYFDKREYDEGFFCVRDAFDQLDGKRPELPWTHKLDRAILSLVGKQERYGQPDKITAYIGSAILDLYKNPHDAWYWSTLATTIATRLDHPLKKDAALCHALFCDALDSSDSREAWQNAITLIQDEPEWERLGESRNVVRRYTSSDFFANTLVFKENTSREALLNEAQNATALDNIVDDITTPKPLHITDETNDEGRYTYVMRYLTGETLYDKLERGEQEHMPDVIRALAQVQARYPLNTLAPLDIEQKLYNKLHDQHFNIPPDLADTLAQHSLPLIRGCASGIPLAANLDAHPEQWILHTHVGMVDFETQHSVPLFFELANLLSYGDHFTPAEIHRYLALYTDSLREEGIRIDPSLIHGAYHTSVMYRMLCLAPAWSAPDRPRMHGYRKPAIERGINSIDRLAIDAPAFYTPHQHSYDIYRQGLRTIANLMES